MKTTTVNLPISSLKNLSLEYTHLVADAARAIDYTADDYTLRLDHFERLCHDFIEIHKALIKTMAEEAGVPQLVASTPKE